MEILLSALAFFVLLSVLILIHEWGHFAAARRAGVVVEEFGFGLPPCAKTLFESGGTKFSINWIPFGGFVRLQGESALEQEEHKAPGSFGAASIPSRLFILCAGVLMNFLLALFILTIGFSVGKWVPLSVYTSLDRMQAAADRGIINLQLGVRINDVVAGGGAARAGVPSNSFLLQINGETITDPAQVVALQKGKGAVEYLVRTEAEGVPLEESYTVYLSGGEAGIGMVPYPLEIEGVRHSVPQAVVLALQDSWVMMVQTTYGIGQLFLSLASSGTVPEGISGIVGIAQYTHTSVQEGINAYLRLVALLSLSLAALNILPFPALDGGRVLFVLAEAIQRKPVNRKFEIITNGMGFLFLIGLLIVITYHDIVRLF